MAKFRRFDPRNKKQGKDKSYQSDRQSSSIKKRYLKNRLEEQANMEFYQYEK